MFDAFSINVKTFIYNLCYRLVSIVIVGLLLSPFTGYGQLSDLHYLPPLKQESNNIGFQQQAIYLSTPETNAFNVNVYQGVGATPVATFSLSNTRSYTYPLGSGDNNITFVNNANTGVVISNSGLRFESENGERFYVNHRGAQSAQGSSLTSKGRAALGKRFRWGGGPVIQGDNTNATLGIMATEDGTTVEISGYDPSTVFRRGNDVDAITDDDLIIILNKGQSYVLEYPIRKLPNYNNTKIYDEWMGASIVADKDIAVSLGNALYSPTKDMARDIAIDQIIPENVLGNEYIFVRGYGNDNLEFPIIIATQNGTEIYVNDSLTPLTTIDAGEYYIVPGSYYSGSGTVRKGENMYVRTSKQAYAYHSTAGANSGANVDYNFVAPVNFLLDSEVNFIPAIQDVGPNKKIKGGITIISASSTPDEEVEVFVGGTQKSLAGKRNSVSGSDLWVTYFLDELNDDIVVRSTNSIAVGFMGESGVVGVSGYFSGFETIPSVDVDVNVVGGCLQDGNVSLSAPNGYAIYQWYKEGEPVSGGTQSTLFPSIPGSYAIGVTQSEEGKEFVSAPVDVSDCLPEVKLDVTSDVQSVTVGESTTVRVNHKYQSFFSASDAEVDLVIPSNFQIMSSSASVGQWSDSSKKWTLGNINPGDEQVLELTLRANAIGDPVTVTASNTQTVKGSDNTTILTEGNSIADDLSEVFTIKNTTVINATSPITKSIQDADFNLSATSNNPNAISYSSSENGIVGVDSDGKVQIKNAGTAVITLSQTASEFFGPGVKTVSISITKDVPVLTNFPDFNKIFGDPDFQLVPPASTSDGPFSYTSSDPSVASIDATSGEVTILKAGTTTITSTQSSTANFNSASIAASLTVSKANQQIIVGTLPDEKTILELIGPNGIGTPIPISATSTSGDPVTITLSSPSIGTLSGSIGNYQLDNVSGSGNMVINFDVQASTNYNTAAKSVTLDVSKRAQTITFEPTMPVSEVYSDNLVLPVTAVSPSSTPMVINVVSGPATVSNDELNITGAGVITYSVNNPGDSIYSAAPEIVKTLVISQGVTVLSDFNITDKSFGEAPFSIPLPTSNRSGDFVFTSSSSQVASIFNGVIEVNTPGTVTITATQPANNNSTSASISTTFDVLKATPVLTGLSSISKKTIDPDFTYTVVSTALNLPMVFRSSDLSVATVNSSTGLISIQGIGTAEIRVSQVATDNYNAASKVLNLTVSKADPTLGPVLNITKTMGDVNFAVPAPTSDSGGSFSFSSSDTGVVTVDGATGVVTTVGIGTATLTISQAATAHYNSASASINVTVNPQNSAPTALAISASSVAENAVTGTVVGTLSATDPDAGDSFTYSLVRGKGDTDNSSFAVSGSNLTTAEVFDFESKRSYSVRLAVTDAGGLSFERVLTLTVRQGPDRIEKIVGDISAPVLNGVTWSPPVVLAKDVLGNPYAGQDVTFAIADGGGTFNKAALSNLSENFTTGGSTVGSDRWKAVIFTTGSAATDVRSISIQLNKDSINNNYPYTTDVQVAIYNTSSGSPDTEIGSSPIQSIELLGNGTWSEHILSNQLTLSANTTYALVVKGSGNNDFKWANTSDTPARIPTGYDGFTFQEMKRSIDSGTSWSDLTSAEWKNIFHLAVGSDVTTLIVTSDSFGRAALGCWNLGGGANPETITATATGLTISPLTFSATEKTLTVDAISDQTYTGSAIEPSVVVKDGSTILVANTEYSLSYANNTDVGTATVKVTGTGNYGGTQDVNFEIVSQSLSAFPVDAIVDQNYTGSAIEPSVVVKDGTTNLTEGTDYSLSYADNTNVGIATVTINGIGNYSGTKSQVFTITKAALTITAENKSKTFGVADPEFTVTYSGLVNGEQAMVLGGALTTTRKPGEEVGDYMITVSGQTSDNYALRYETGTLTITEKSMTDADITVDAIANLIYTGNAQDPPVVVKDGTTNLTEGTDYSLSYADNINVGIAKVTINGIGNYSGTKSQVFTITKAALTITAENKSKTFGVADPEFTVTYSGLVNGEQATVLGGALTTTRKTGEEVGDYMITVSGQTSDNYALRYETGTLTITEKSMTDADITVDAIADLIYTGNAQDPPVVVKDGTTNLTEGTDYSLSYADNINVGTATVMISGTGSYSGTQDVNFEIVSQSLSTFPVDAIVDQTYTGSAIEPSVVVNDSSATLVLDTDYTLSYSDNVNAGTAFVRIQGINNYSGLQNKTFEIVKAPLVIRADDRVRTYGFGSPALTFSYEGLVNGEARIEIEPSISTLATDSSPAGVYPIELTGGVDPNYEIKLVNGTLVIGRKALTIRADDKARTYGFGNPALTFTYEGLVNGDKVIETEPGIGTAATQGSNVGTYPITLTGGSDDNYDIELQAGELKVMKASLTIIAEDQSKVYDLEDPEFTYSVAGLIGSDKLTGSLSRESGEDVGKYSITLGSLTAGDNYQTTYSAAQLEIIPTTIKKIIEIGFVPMEWGSDPDLPIRTTLMATNGKLYILPITWDVSALDKFSRGSYLLDGNIGETSWLSNPEGIKASLKVVVHPKSSPRDVTLSNSSFEGSPKDFFISVGNFVVDDPVDDIHVVELYGEGYDNRFFEIKDNIFFWSSAERAEGKSRFTVIVQVTDRDGNTLEKFFEIQRVRPTALGIEIFKSFTPNGDGRNDSWGVPGLRFYGGVRIQVFERSGARVFYTEDPDIRWDGTHKGKKLPAGTYHWIIEVGETGEVRKGMLNLLTK